MDMVGFGKKTSGISEREDISWHESAFDEFLKRTLPFHLLAGSGFHICFSTSQSPSFDGYFSMFPGYGLCIEYVSLPA